MLDARAHALLELREDAAALLDGALQQPDTVKSVLERGGGLLRRHEEPVWWRRGATALDALSAPVLGVGLVRIGAGVLVLAGPRLVVARVAGTFEAAGRETLAMDQVAVPNAPSTTLRARHWGEIDPIEIWNVGFGVDTQFVRERLTPERALVNLLEVTFSRPSEGALDALAACAERIPQFLTTFSERSSDLERVVAAYGR